MVNITADFCGFQRNFRVSISILLDTLKIL
jgi:hypothetical protein